jgi:hypothetical protein
MQSLERMHPDRDTSRDVEDSLYLLPHVGSS